MRLAFSYAVDRQALVDNVTKGGVAARWFSRPGIAAAPTLENSPKLGIGYDPEAAKKSLQAYLDEKKITVDQLPPITLLLYQNELVGKVAEAIQQMWEKNLGIRVTITSQEFKNFLETIKNDPPQVYALGWTADYPDANNFLREVFRSTSGNNFTRWKNETYDKLVDTAAAESELAKRLELYSQAEDILVLKDAVIIPLYWGTRAFLTKPYVERTVSQINGDERFEKWDVKR
jgi:oligopeptide transport system substrate-binding protein